MSRIIPDVLPAPVECPRCAIRTCTDWLFMWGLISAVEILCFQCKIDVDYDWVAHYYAAFHP